MNAPSKDDILSSHNVTLVILSTPVYEYIPDPYENVDDAVDIFIEKEKKQKLTILKKVLGEEVYEKLLQLSNNYGKEIEARKSGLKKQ